MKRLLIFGLVAFSLFDFCSAFASPEIDVVNDSTHDGGSTTGGIDPTKCPSCDVKGKSGHIWGGPVGVITGTPITAQQVQPGEKTGGAK